jgi:hypothetical protein
MRKNNIAWFDYGCCHINKLRSFGFQVKLLLPALGQFFLTLQLMGQSAGRAVLRYPAGGVKLAVTPFANPVKDSRKAFKIVNHLGWPPLGACWTGARYLVWLACRLGVPPLPGCPGVSV